jgi:hypothetical protein
LRSCGVPITERLDGRQRVAVISDDTNGGMFALDASRKQ